MQELLVAADARAERCIELAKADGKDQTEEFRHLVACKSEISVRRHEIAVELERIEQNNDSVAAESHKARLDTWLQRHSTQGPFGSVGRSAWISIAAMLAVYFSLAWTASLGNANDVSSNTANAVLELLNYGSRVAGAVPQVCVQLNDTGLTDVGLPGRVSKPESSNGTVGASWSAGGTPLFVQWFFDDLKSTDGRVCEWRIKVSSSQLNPFQRLAVHVLAALSPDVGTIQKICLFLMVWGMMELRQIREEREFAREILRDPAYPHGLSVLPTDEDPNQEKVFTLFPRRSLSLCVPTDFGDPFEFLQGRLSEVRTSLRGIPGFARTMGARLLDYIGDLYTAGLVSETVDALAERADRMENTYREHLLDRFWRIDYSVWLLPTLGFIGTIYGISLSLVQAKGIFASADDTPEGASDAKSEFGEVVDALGVAFDTTAFALLLLAFLIWFQKREEAQARDFGETSARIVQEKLITNLRNRSERSDVSLSEETTRYADLLYPQ